MCEKSTNVREGSCIVVIMVAKGGEGGVTDAPLKNTRVTTLRSKENSLTFTEPKIMPQGRTVATEQIRKREHLQSQGFLPENCYGNTMNLR